MVASNDSHDKDASASRDAEFEALLQELRVLLPGVEILFAFLLTVAFTERFAAIARHLKWLYLVALSASAIASILLTTPSVYHRMRWREAHKEDVLRRSNALAVAGTVFLAIAATMGLFVAVAAVFDSTVGGIVAGLIGGVTLLFWYVLPLADRVSDSGESRGEREGSSRGEREPPSAKSKSA